MTTTRSLVDGCVEFLLNGTVASEYRFRVSDLVDVDRVLRPQTECIVVSGASQLALCPAISESGWLILISLERRAALSPVDPTRSVDERIAVRHGGDVMDECAQWIVSDLRAERALCSFLSGTVSLDALGDFALYDGSWPDLALAGRALAEHCLRFGLVR